MPGSSESVASDNTNCGNLDGAGVPEQTLWQSVRSLWCRHSQTIVTPRTALMPPHVVCQTCGWREPAETHRPQGVRTWDSSRDEARYLREKRRRAALESRKQSVASQLAAPQPKPAKARRARKENVVQLKRA